MLQIGTNLSSIMSPHILTCPSRDTLYVARMARDLMWEGDSSINLDEFVLVSQT